MKGDEIKAVAVRLQCSGQNGGEARRFLVFDFNAYRPADGVCILENGIEQTGPYLQCRVPRCDLRSGTLLRAAAGGGKTLRSGLSREKAVAFIEQLTVSAGGCGPQPQTRLPEASASPGGIPEGDAVVEEGALPGVSSGGKEHSPRRRKQRRLSTGTEGPQSMRPGKFPWPARPRRQAERRGVRTENPLLFSARTCIHRQGMLDGRKFFLSDKEFFCGNPDGLQGKPARYGGKKAVQTAFSGCEYRFQETGIAPLPISGFQRFTISLSAAADSSARSASACASLSPRTER